MNAVNNKIHNARFFCANLEKEEALDCVAPYEFNKMLIDPPRLGALSVMKQIDKLQLKRIVYVSCNPATLARDADVLVNQKGFRMSSVGVMDMFPHTAHVESIALFLKE
jgi:23S rRNA (uracil1939-C5)-methyltransferase